MTAKAKDPTPISAATQTAEVTVDLDLDAIAAELRPIVVRLEGEIFEFSGRGGYEAARTGYKGDYEGALAALFDSEDDRVRFLDLRPTVPMIDALIGKVLGVDLSEAPASGD